MPFPKPIALSPKPFIVLVRPQMGENIGGVARAMSNFGLSELRLVAPRDGWPNRKAQEMASGGAAIIESAQVFPDFASAIADIQFAYATTARSRDMAKPVLTPEEAMAEMRGCEEAKMRGEETPSSHPHIFASSHRVAFVFGPERTGLENEEVTLCDALITIPTAENFSLNLAQSAVILGYEWWKTQSVFQCSESRVQSSEKEFFPESLVTKDEMLGLFEQLESYLDAADYFRVDHKKPIMWQNLRTMLLRARMNTQEVRTFRGMLRILWEKPRKAKEKR